jgi:hypothetical protein
MHSYFYSSSPIRSTRSRTIAIQGFNSSTLSYLIQTVHSLALTVRKPLGIREDRCSTPKDTLREYHTRLLICDYQWILPTPRVEQRFKVQR